MKAWKAESWLLFITFVWGGTFTFTKLGLNDCSPSLYISIRFSIALILALSFLFKYLKNFKKGSIIHGLILGSFFGCGFILQTYGLKFTSIPKSAFITGISVLLTPFVYWLVERKNIVTFQKLGVLIAGIGLYLFTNPRFDNLNIGDVLTLASTFFWAFYITYMDVFTRGKDSKNETAHLVIFQYVAAIPISLISMFLLEMPTLKFNLNTSLFCSLLYNGAIASFLLTLIHTTVQRFTSPVKAALIFGLEPVVASIIALIIFHDILTSIEWLGGTLLISGVLVSETGEKLFKKNLK